MKALELTVHAGPHPRRDCPITVEVPVEGDPPRRARVHLPTGEELAAQMIGPPPLTRREAGLRRWLAFVLPELAAGKSVALRVELGTGDPAWNGVTVSDNGAGEVAVAVLGQPLTTYRYLHNPARPCFFPLLGPGGKRVTRSWPVADDVPGETQDHPHHRSLWVAHGDVNGVDNWSEMKGHGYQLHREIIAAAGGPALGWVATRNDWTDREERKVLEERRMLTAWALDGEARILDLDVCFTASEGDVRFGDTKEGGILALRVATAMDGDHGGRIENAYGAVGEEECWGRRAQWCDYVGEVEGERLGIAVFDHPRSFRHPTYWHVRDYGMYTANPFGWHDFHGNPALDGSFVLQQGASLWFHYRVCLHRGGTAEARVGERYHDYAHPPRVQVKGS